MIHSRPFGIVSGLLIAVLALLPASCGKKDKAGSEQPAAGISAHNEAATDPVDLQALNQTLRNYVQLKKVVPRDLNELVTSGYVARLPTPPAGKKFAIALHPMGYSVVLVDE